MALPETVLPQAPPVLSHADSRRVRLGIPWVLAGLALLSRLALWSFAPGESDSARFLIGFQQWTRLGPSAPMIYGQLFSPGYYWLGLTFFRHFAVPAAAWTGVLTAFSILAATLSAPLLYAIARRWLDPVPAAWSTALLLLAPGLWWLGIEPHPQGLSFACFLVSFWAWLRAWERRGRSAWVVLSIAALAAGLLLKCDLILLAAAYPGALLSLRGGQKDESRPQVWRRVIASAVLALGTAAGVFLVLRQQILQRPYGWLESQAQHTVGLFWGLPADPTGWIKQLLPLLTAGGLAITLALGVAAVRFWFRSDDGQAPPRLRRRWAWLLATWSAPSAIFWLLIRGNNARHMVELLPPLFWLGAAGATRWRRHWRRWALGIFAAGWLLLPANSNLTLYPSPNVPGSVRDLHRQQAVMASELFHPKFPAPDCYLGNYTLPYLEWDMVLHAPRGAAVVGKPDEIANAAGAAIFPGPSGPLRFVEVNSPAAERRAARACRRPASFEYDLAGRHRWFLGRELRFWQGAR